MRLFTQLVLNRNKVSMVEVGPRDGLQNEAKAITLDQKVKMIELLAAAGLKDIEAGAFVSPKWVPQMASSAQVIGKAMKLKNTNISALVPNAKGMQEAMATGLKRVAVFTTVSETFSQKNTNCTVAESLNRIKEVINLAKPKGIQVRAYVSCVVGCPYEGKMDAGKVRELTQALLHMGCYEVSLGDSIGIATPKDIRGLLSGFNGDEMKRIAGHYHDTYGMAVANVLASVEMGVRTIDASVGGLGGCPYAPGAAGNVATEEVVYLLHGLGENTGVDIDKLVAAAEYSCGIVNRTPSKLARAMLKKDE